MPYYTDDVTEFTVEPVANPCGDGLILKLAVDLSCPECGKEYVELIERIFPGSEKRCVCGCSIKYGRGDGRPIQQRFERIQNNLVQTIH